ncbi:hypothetical protein B0A55_06306 [Friedmanniomyces simplex]|uniref:AB hydrolase-1 domain-containing protein n=1 Tax=Friedmanniomyces simplex TaxID=329884 RepID=A0A4U0XCU4_9PEZI|nr:hypothetical protein B0A55_06306 [Friedmanniomyces simplex]
MDSLQEKHLDTKRGLHYRYYLSSSGSPSQPTLLLLHGWPDSALLWQYMLQHLAQLKLKIVIPDLLGYGGTSKPTQPELYDHRLIAQDVSEILDAEHIDKVIPIGHDFGCWFTTRFHLHYPERCVATVHIGIAYMPPITEMPSLEALNAMTEQQVGYPRYSYFHFFTAPDAPAIFAQHMESTWHVLHGDREDWIKYIFCTPNAMRDFIAASRTDVPLRPYAQDHKLKREWMAGLPTAADWEATLCWYRAFVDGVQSEADTSIPVERYRLELPVLTIMCEADWVNPPKTLEAPKQAGLLPDLREAVLPCGHWCPYEAPEELSRMIVEFVREKGFAG